MKFFILNTATNQIMVNDCVILLLPEFRKLWNEDRNVSKSDKDGKKRMLAFKEFTYIWWMLDWESPYRSEPEMTRHDFALQISGLTDDEFNDVYFRSACRAYKEFQEEKAISLRLLKSVYNTVNRFIDYFNNVDPMERNDDGKPIYKAKDIMDEVNKLDMVTESLVKLEMKVKSQMNETGNIRGGEVDGYLPK